VKYAGERIVFGRPIGQIKACSFQLLAPMPRSWLPIWCGGKHPRSLTRAGLRCGGEHREAAGI